MSMNLECKEVSLWQTPTFITYMCFSSNDGGWEGILYRYKMWVNYETQVNFNRAVKCPEEQARIRQEAVEHIAALDKAVKDHQRLTFSI